MGFKTPLATAKGQGANQTGSEHFISQRVTALLLLLLTPWLAISLIQTLPLDYATVNTWLSDPWQASLLAMWLISAAYHGQLGIQVVIEDYISPPAWRYSLIFSSYVILLLCLLLALFSLIALQ